MVKYEIAPHLGSIGKRLIWWRIEILHLIASYLDCIL